MPLVPEWLPAVRVRHPQRSSDLDTDPNATTYRYSNANSYWNSHQHPAAADQHIRANDHQYSHDNPYSIGHTGLDTYLHLDPCANSDSNRPLHTAADQHADYTYDH